MFFGPKFASLVFTDNFIKIASAKASSKGLKIQYLAKHSLPSGAVFNGRIINENLFREALKTFYLENYEQIKTRNLVLGLNEQEIFITSQDFEKKPKNVSKEIGQKIVGKLPFDLSNASIRYREVSNGFYQVVATRTDTLSLLSSIFQEVGFSLKAIVPIPLVFPKLVGDKKAPYLFISSGDDLTLSLVINNVTIFSLTFKLKKRLVDSEKEIVKIVEEIITEKYPQNSSEPLRDIYIFGAGTEFLRIFLSSKNFNIQIVSTFNDSSPQTGYDVAQFSRVITLSFYDDSVLSFKKLQVAAQQNENIPGKKKASIFIYFLLLILITLVFLLIFFGANIKDSFFNLIDRSSPPPEKEATTSQVPKPKEATPAAEGTGTTESAKPKETNEEVNKKNFKIRILNGSGKAGTASEAKNFLTSRGYKVVSIGNADNFNYQKTVVRVKESRQSITNPLTKDLKERYAISVSSFLPENESYDVLIIIGG